MSAEDFSKLQQELDSKHDRYDKLAKLSRECTSLSKKAIFHLHRTYVCPTDGTSETAQVLKDTEDKFAIISGILKEMATEIATANEDPFRYQTAYSQGVQEFIEALSYWTFCRTGKLLTLTQAERWFRLDGAEFKAIHLPLHPTDFILGIADLTGELMRACTESATRGNRFLPFMLLPFMRALYSEFLKLPATVKALPKKIEVLEGSLLKVEHVCYTLTVRGSEIHSGHLLSINVNEEASNFYFKNTNSFE